MTEVLRNLPVPEEHLAGMALALLFGHQRALPLPGSRRLLRLTGWSLVAVGSALNGWALAERRRRTAGAFDLERPDSLVTTGPYAMSRHPMYVGWWLIHVGVGVLGGSAWVLVTAPASVLLGHPGALSEEQAMADAFGEGYREYARTVPRYLPGTPNRPVYPLRSAEDQPARP